MYSDMKYVFRHKVNIQTCSNFLQKYSYPYLMKKRCLYYETPIIRFFYFIYGFPHATPGANIDLCKGFPAKRWKIECTGNNKFLGMWSDLLVQPLLKKS